MLLTTNFEAAKEGGLIRVPIPAGYLDIDWAQRSQTVIARFREVVRQYPERLAVTDDQMSWTYSQLDSVANRIAHAILDRLPDTSYRSRVKNSSCMEDTAEPVVVLLPQGAYSVAATIAVLKAGKLLVPVDPTDSAHRIKHILQDSSAKLLVTDSASYSAAGQLGAGLQGVIKIEDLPPQISDADPALDLASESLASLVYTSGSTGDAKGVMHSHASLVADVWQKSVFYRISPQDHCSLLGSATGQAIKNAFLALLNGAALFPHDTRGRGFERPLQWMRENRISVLTIAAPFYRAVMKGITATDQFPDLRLLRLTSDQVVPEDIDSFKRHIGERSVLLNTLSSTETGTICGYVFDRSTSCNESRVPVGFPLKGNQVRLLNDNNNGLAAGVGTIAVGTPALFSGYWRKRELTQNSFVEISGEGACRMFRTNDTARLRSDGALVLVGRRDFQVKIRGFLVETPEVEATLRKHAAVDDAIVHPWEDASGQRRLVAYWVPKPVATVTDDELRTFVAERLTASMVPSFFVKMDELPLLAVGKIDRQALPSPANTRPDLRNTFVDPQNATQQALVDIWREVLGIEQVGIHDSFFELGGDSLSTLRLLVQLEQQFAVNIAPKDFFLVPTIAQLASLLCAESTAKPDSPEQGGSSDSSAPRSSVLSYDQAEAVITLYDRIEQDKIPAKTWKLRQATWRPQRRWASRLVNVLPYPVVFKLLQSSLSHRSVQQLFFQHYVRFIRRFLAVIDSDAQEDHVLKMSLLFGSLNHFWVGPWGLQREIASLRRYRAKLSVDGSQVLERAIEGKKGTLLVQCHDISRWWSLLLEYHRYRFGGVQLQLNQLQLQGDIVRDALFSHALNTARQILQSGGVVTIAGDGRQGRSQGIDYQFHGRCRRFRTGFAELALMTGASVIPVFGSVAWDGHVTLKFGEPLDAGDDTMSREERVKSLVDQYVALFHKMWAKTPWMVSWEQMDKHLALPLQADSNGKNVESLG